MVFKLLPTTALLSQPWSYEQEPTWTGGSVLYFLLGFDASSWQEESPSSSSTCHFFYERHEHFCLSDKWFLSLTQATPCSLSRHSCRECRVWPVATQRALARACLPSPACYKWPFSSSVFLFPWIILHWLDHGWNFCTGPSRQDVLKGQRRPLCLGPEGLLHLEGPTVALCGNNALRFSNRTLLKGSHLCFLSIKTMTSIILSDSCGKAPLRSKDFREWQAAQRCAGSTHQDHQYKNYATCVKDQWNLSTQYLSTVPIICTF